MSDPAAPAPRILNVNDDLPARYITTRILRQAGFIVLEAESGQDALKVIHAQAPDLVVLDVNLPDIDGFEVCRRIKSNPLTASIPVLHLSASRVSGNDRTVGLESGADSYLTQPVQPTELIASVRALLRLSQAEERARRAAQDWEAVFNAIGDGVCLLDGAGKIRRCNRAFAQIVGASRLKLTGCLFKDIAGKLFPDAKLELPEAAAGAAGRTVQQLRAGLRWLRVTIEAAPDGGTGSEAVLGAVVVLTDITDTRDAAQRQRVILRDILASVTEGQLHLCFSTDELPQPLPTEGPPVYLTRPTVRTIRQQVRETAAKLQFPEERGQDLETAVGEGAMNAVVHAKEGIAQICSDGACTIQIWLQDRGEGISIERLPQATLERGYTTAGSLGHGFYLMLKTVDRIYLMTGPSGTTVVLEQDRVPVTPSWVDRM